MSWPGVGLIHHFGGSALVVSFCGWAWSVWKLTKLLLMVNILVTPTFGQHFTPNDASGHNWFNNFATPQRERFLFVNTDLERKSTNNIREENDLFLGPTFVHEPGTGDYQLVIQYSNWTQANINCKVTGYPKPNIRWRVDNITVPVGDSVDDQYAQQYWGPLNAYISVRNEGQTLTVGGLLSTFGPMQSENNIPVSNNFNQIPPHIEYASAINTRMPILISHHVQCLATNQFGSIISRPVIVQQCKYFRKIRKKILQIRMRFSKFKLKKFKSKKFSINFEQN